MNMISPNAAVPTHELLENKANGQAYWAFVPDHPHGVAEGLPEIAEYSTFQETADILAAAQEAGSVFVEGPPGAGKSHLVRELQEAAIIHDVPTFCLTTQINQGKRDGIENIQEPFAAFREAAAEGGGLVILDNIDMVGYKGGSKRRGAIAAYAESAQKFVEEVTHDPKLITVATGHDELWRAIRWSWQDPVIDQASAAILESFGARTVFEGKMTLLGLTRVITEKGHNFGIAARAVRQMRRDGVDNFYHANHLEPGKYLTDKDAALAELYAGREERRGK